MKNKKIGLLGLAAFVCANAWASGNGAGNGGGAWVCRDAKGEIATAKFWDYYEIENVGHVVDLKGVTVPDYLRTIEQRISALKDDDLLSMLKSESRKFLKSDPGLVLFSNLPLASVTDGHEVVELKRGGCQREQAAIRLSSEDRKLYDADYLLQKQIWEKLSPRDQAGLIAHESFYKFSQEPADSRAGRTLNQFFSSEHWSKVNFIEYFQWRVGLLNQVTTFKLAGEEFSAKNWKLKAGDLIAYHVDERIAAAISAFGLIDEQKSWPEGACRVKFSGGQTNLSPKWDASYFADQYYRPRIAGLDDFVSYENNDADSRAARPPGEIVVSCRHIPSIEVQVYLQKPVRLSTGQILPSSNQWGTSKAFILFSSEVTVTELRNNQVVYRKEFSERKVKDGDKLANLEDFNADVATSTKAN